MVVALGVPKPIVYLAIVFALALLSTSNNITGFVPLVPFADTGDGSLVENTTWQSGLTGLYYSSAAFGDIDNDGDSDLVLIGYDDALESLVLYENTGSTLALNSTWSGSLIGLYHSSVAWGDIDNDGDLDLAAIGTDGVMAKAMIFTNDGSTLTENSTWQTNLTGVFDGSAAFGDIDNDGKLDLALIGDDDSNARAFIYINNGTSLVENSTWETNLTGLYNSSLALGDIDNDGNLDLVSTGYNGADRNIYVYISNGTSLVSSTGWNNNMVGVERGSLAFGDIDSDGDLDLVQTGFDGNNPRGIIYVNDDNSLTSNSVWATDLLNLNGLYNSSIAWGDIDTDGDLDLAVIGTDSTATTAYAYILINNGTSLVENSTWETGLNGLFDGSLALGDIDNDNDLDLVTTGFDVTTASAYIYINNITGSNTAPSPPSTSFSSSYSGDTLTLSWGDGSDTETSANGLYYNLRVGTSSGSNNIISGVYGGSANPTAGYFGNMVQRQSISLKVPDQTYYWSVQTIDAGLKKSEWSDERSYRLLYENKTWEAELTDLYNGDAAWADIDNDGDLDLVLTGALDDPPMTAYAKIYINNGTSLVEDSAWQSNLTGVYTSSLAWADIDNDGDLDLALTGNHVETGPSAFIYINNGTSLVENSTWETDLTAIRYCSIAFGDIDNDGKLDLVTTGNNGTNPSAFIYINNGTSLVENSTWENDLTGVKDSSIVLGDIDNDGDLDLAAFGEDPVGFATAYIYINNGTSLVENSTWETNITILSEPSIAFADIDNDGDLDLAAFGEDENGARSFIYINNGTSLVENSTWQTNITGLNNPSFALGDLDNDGKLDLVSTGSDPNGVYIASVYINNRTSLVENITWQTNLTNVYLSSLALGDIDNDGKLDLVLTGYDDVSIYSFIYINYISGSNTAPSPPSTSFSSSYSGDTLTLSWGDGSDTETSANGLYYNLRVGTTSRANDIVTGVYGGSSNPTAGYFGNMLQRNSINLKISNQTYYWSIQTIDAGLRNSTWSTEQITDSTPPSITIQLPQNTSYNSNDTWFNATLNEAGSWMAVSWGNGNNTMTNLTGNWYYNNNSMPDDSYAATFYANDTAGNENSNTVTFTIDTINPTNIVTVSPTLANNSYTTNNWVYVNITFTETNPDSCILEWTNSSGAMNITASPSNSNCYWNLTNQPDGNWNYSIYANDSAGNEGKNTTFQPFFVNVDTTKPLITLISPADSSSWTTSGTVTFAYNASDGFGIANCSLIIGSSIDQTDTSVTANIQQTFSKTMTNADYNWYVNCTDTAGNVNNSETRTLTVSYTPVPPIGGGGGVVTLPGPCAGITCSPITQTCSDGYVASCTPICISTTGACGSCTPDCTGHDKIEEEKKCPVCLKETEWSKCESNKQTRTSWYCSKSTDYECVSKEETRDCYPCKVTNTFPESKLSLMFIAENSFATCEINNPYVSVSEVGILAQKDIVDGELLLNNAESPGVPIFSKEQIPVFCELDSDCEENEICEDNVCISDEPTEKIIYKYFDISKKTLEEEQVKTFTIDFYIENENWIDKNNIDIKTVKLHKFDETNELWEEISTNYLKTTPEHTYFQASSSDLSIFAVAGDKKQQCTGDISIELPDAANPEQKISAVVSGLKDCEIKLAEIKFESCEGETVCSVMTFYEKASCEFKAPEIPEFYNYYACIDKNEDGDFSDSGESDYDTIEVTNENINAFCGNGKIEAGETTDNCCKDIGCSAGSECINNKCELRTCNQLNGIRCSSDQVCYSGAFIDSNDLGTDTEAVCCVKGRCVTPKRAAAPSSILPTLLIIFIFLIIIGYIAHKLLKKTKLPKEAPPVKKPEERPPKK